MLKSTNPIKNILPTPLSMNYIANINSLSKLPMSLYKYCIDIAISTTIKMTNNQTKFINILKRQKITSQNIDNVMNAVTQIQKILDKISKLMQISEADQVSNNLENCQKYIKNVFTQNTLLSEDQINYLTDKTSSRLAQILSKKTYPSSEKPGKVDWALFNLKRVSLPSSLQYPSSDSLGKQLKSSHLSTINKLYIKLSLQSLTLNRNNINSEFIECKRQGVGTSKTITMSLIDYKLWMQQMEGINGLHI